MQNLFNLNPISEKKASIISSQTLAFVGDAVHSLFIRQKVVLSNKFKIKDLHLTTVQYVKAGGQSEASAKLIDEFNFQELAIYKRARNYKTTNISKNSSVGDYKRATGFEAVLGFLYLSGQFDRLQFILNKSLGEHYDN